MSRIDNSEALGLPRRTVIEKISPDTMAIVITRKSRIIMADGKKIVANAVKIMKAKPGTKVVLKTTAPVCRKTKHFLMENGIGVVHV